MKIFRKTAVLTVMIATLSGLYGCSSDTTAAGNSTGAGGGGMNTITSESSMYDAILAVAPSFSSAPAASLNRLTSAGKEVPTEWRSGNPVYDIFYILRDFNPQTDQGVIDTSNVFKTLWESRGMVSTAKAMCQPIELQIIPSPFDFGNRGVEYNCAYNDVGTESGYDSGFAIVELDADGNVIGISASTAGVQAAESEGEESGEEGETTSFAVVQKILRGFVWVDPSHNEYGVLEGVLDASSQEVALDIAIWVDYDGDDDYCYRNEIAGNTQTHEFTFRSAKGNLSGISMSLVGAGVSQGEGEHFLLKMVEGSVEDRYFCIDADDGESELQLLDPEGLAEAPEDCAALTAEVESITAIVASELLCESADLNPGRTGVAEEGTIFVNYN